MKRQSDTEPSEWAIKIHLGVTIAAMIAAANLALNANAARPPSPPSHPEPGGRSLSSSILHRHFDIDLVGLCNRPAPVAPSPLSPNFKIPL